MTTTATAISPLVTALNGVLFDSYALAVKTHAAHWNVTGPGFFQLHEAFGSQYEALFVAADTVAERVRALGATAPAGIAAIANATTISDNAGHDDIGLAKALAADHRALSAACAKAIVIAQSAHDEGSADLLIGRIEEHDKTAWMLESVSR